MKKSLGKKICMAGIGLIVMFVILNIVLTYFFMIPFSVYRSRQQMERIALTLQNDDSYSDDEFKETIEEISEDLNTQVTIVDGEKNIISTNRENFPDNKKLGINTGDYFDENRGKLDSGASVFRAKVMTTGKKKLDENRIKVTLIKKVSDERYAVLSRSYRSLQNATTAAIVFDLLAGIVIILLGVFFVMWFSRYILNPIRDMTEAAEHISNMEFDKKVPITTEDELGQLGKSINRMSDHLEENLAELQDDIEKRKRLVRNLSHEIKSPVAVIMGYADRLSRLVETDTKKAVKYSQIISNESARVDILVREMLELSRLEQQTEELNRESFQAERLFDDLKKRFEEENIDKKYKYLEEYDKSEKLVADYILLERAIYNLLRNAISYGSGDDLIIRIRGVLKDGFYEFYVYNSGSRIDVAEQDAIWEAFSKVDKVRTRGSQSFGVGLSIVKEIVDAHEGYCSVKNVEDGVEFMAAVKII